ncbi:hypothetical protein [Cetobacterium sp. 2A]|uniref:hypothetical protein n=1 Tax=Cetobacterium sp. 2A TaxID=2754723 RepID=UPI00163BD542|nr:hypothetical protein [Cetobacterium sp. 2A]
MVDIRELFNSGFISKNTKFESISEFFNSIGILETEIEKIFNLDKTYLNNKISEVSDFKNFDEMLYKAKIIYLEKKILKW